MHCKRPHVRETCLTDLNFLAFRIFPIIDTSVRFVMQVVIGPNIVIWSESDDYTV